MTPQGIGREARQGDVCVIGGGPAGSSVAVRLAALGHDVILVEREPRCGSRLIASLPPNIWPFLDQLDLRDAVLRAGFHWLRGSQAIWGEADPTAEPQRAAPTLMVEQSRFQDLLLDAASRAGVEVRRAVLAGTPRRDPSDGAWHTPVKDAEGATTLRSRIVVDATGRRAVTGGQRRRCSVPTLALQTRWRGRWAAEQCSILEALPDGWIWFAPFAPGKACALAFVDPQRPRRRGAAPTYREMIAQSRFVRGALGSARIGRVSACDASSLVSPDDTTERPLRIGDASLSLDPMSSQGILSAIAGGFQAAVVTNTMLARPDNTAVALRFHNDRRAEKAEAHSEKTAMIYAEAAETFGTPFWRARIGPAPFRPLPAPRRRAPLPDDLPVMRAPGLRIRPEPVITGETIELAPTLALDHWARPIAYLNEIPLALLMDQVPEIATPRDMIARWSGSVSEETGWKLANWLWENGALVPAPSA